MSRRLIIRTVALLMILAALAGFLKKIWFHGGNLSAPAVSGVFLNSDSKMGEDSATDRVAKNERLPDQFALAMAGTGLEGFFAEVGLNEEVSLFQNASGFRGFHGKVSMLHTAEDGSRIARMKEKRKPENGHFQSRTVFLAETGDGYEGFLREDGARHVFKFSNFERRSDLLVTKVPLDRFLCVSISGGEIAYGLPEPPPDQHGCADASECFEPELGAAASVPSHSAAQVDGPAQDPTSDYTIPMLSSKPSMDKVLYLDFDGQKVTGTVWNENQSPIWVKTIVGNQIDSEFIRKVWLKVSAAFLPFNVNVTTDYRKFSKAKASKRWRMLGSSDPGQLGLSDTGGISYIGVFGRQYYQPSFFFVQSHSAPDTVARLVIHEAGHVMGLSHDGRKHSPSMEYYEPHGQSPRRWATWMGSSYGADITQWSRGEYSLANNKENDLEIISAALGAAGRGSSSLRKPIGISLPGSRTGQIVSKLDSDYFVIKGGKGRKVKITVSPRMGSTSLFPSLSVMDVNGAPIASKKYRWKRGVGINARLVLPEEEVILKVSGSGFGRPSTIGSGNFPSGASRYGSIGPYTVRVRLE